MVMNRNIFGGTPLHVSSHATAVNESKTADMYVDIWDNKMSQNDKVDIAKELKVKKIPNGKYDNLTDAEMQIALDMAAYWTDKNECSESATQLTLAAIEASHALKVDEGWFKWIVGMVALRFIWKKVSKSFKNKIMKIAGVPQSLWNNYNAMDIDNLPIAYKGKVANSLRDNYDGSVNESLVKEIANVLNDAKSFEHTDATFCNEAFGIVEAHPQLLINAVHPFDEALTDVEAFEAAQKEVQTARYQHILMQPVQCDFGVKFEADFRTGNAKKAWNELSAAQRTELCKLLGVKIDEAGDAQSVKAKVDIKLPGNRVIRAGTELLSCEPAKKMSQGNDAEDLYVIRAKASDGKTAYTQVCASELIFESMCDELYEQDGKVFTNAGKESVIKKLDTGEYGIAGEDGKLWDSKYDSLKAAAEALKSYHAGNSDETKLEDAYHEFIDRKLKEWMGKEKIGELSNDEKKIFFGRIKRAWPKKKAELGFTD